MAEEAKKNGVVAVLTQLAHSGHAWVQFGTLVLIGLTGLGNWVATWESADRNKDEIEISRKVAWEGQEKVKDEVRRQVADIHKWMIEATEEFHKGNADSAANRRTLNQLMREDLEAFERRQVQALENQNQMMKSDAQLLNDTHQIVKRLEDLKRQDQLRGAPP